MPTSYFLSSFGAMRRFTFLYALFFVFCIAAVQGIENPTNNKQTTSGEERIQLSEKMSPLAKTVTSRMEDVEVTVSNGARPPVSDSVKEIYTASAKLQLSKARAYINDKQPGEARDSLQKGKALLDNGNPEKLPDQVKWGKLRELAYIAANDRSAQPYYLYKPDDISEPRPLVVFLHGWVPTTSRINPYLVPDFVIEMVKERNAILALAHGRTNTDFQYVGERDVLRVIREVKKFHPVDPSRVYLLGVSMGGAGAWHLGVHYPDLFAGIAPINGQADWFQFWRRQYGRPERKDLPSHIAWLTALNNPVDLAQNLKHLYSFSQCAEQGFLGVSHTKKMVKQLKKIEAPFDRYIYKGGRGHYSYTSPESWERAFDKLFSHKRQKHPETIRYKTYSLRFPGAYWLEIKRLRKSGKPATYKATRLKGNAFQIETKNATAVKLAPPAKWVSDAGNIQVQWNGHQAVTVPLNNHGKAVLTQSGDGTVRKEKGKEEGNSPEKTSDNLKKTTQLCGPVPDVFNFPFVAVRGTSGSEEETAAIKQLAFQFKRDWQSYAEGNVRILKDKEVTDELMQKRNLILFGFPHTNEIIARLNDALPFKLTSENIVLPDERRYSADEHGLILTYPNPLVEKDRYIVIYHGFPWGEHRSKNHKFDRIPDFVIYSPERAPDLNVNLYKAAGFFNTEWEYTPANTDFLEK